MNGLWKKAILLGVIGMALGILVSAIFVFAFNAPAEPGFTMGELLRFLLLGGLFGMISMGSTVVYDVEEWSITRSTITHFVITIVFFYIFGFSLNWFSPGDLFMWIMTAAFLVAYFIIWLIQYLIYKRKVRKLNESLEKWKSSHQEDEK